MARNTEATNILDDNYEQFKGILAGFGYHPTLLKENAHLRNDLEIDLLGVIDLMMAAEDLFNVRVPDEVVDRLQTFGQAYEAVAAKLRK